MPESYVEAVGNGKEIGAADRVVRVLVLMATCNGVPWIERQLISILGQQGVEVGVLVGDDLSKDGTISVLDSLCGANPAVTVFRWESPSGSAGGNFKRLILAADPAAFDFVALADQDDIWSERKLEVAVRGLLNTGGQAYSCGVEAFWPSGKRKVLSQSLNVTAADFLFEGAGQGCTFVMAKKFFEQVQEFCRRHPQAADGLHYHDWLIYLLARASSTPWCFDGGVWLKYRQHAGNEIGARGSGAAIRRRIRMISNGWYRGQIMAAGRAYELAGGRDPRVLRIIEQINGPRSPLQRIALAGEMLVVSRRRIIDRFVLSMSVLIGWI